MKYVEHVELRDDILVLKFSSGYKTLEDEKRRELTYWVILSTGKDIEITKEDYLSSIKIAELGGIIKQRFKP